MACESHAPPTAVQQCQEERLKNVRATRDAKAQTLQACSALQQSAAGIQARLFPFNATAARGNPLYQPFVYLTQRLGMTHRKKQHISLCGRCY